ncbi:MAG: hypothetical protein EAZ99_06445 [Alphaproteobacteria bacterium]|nr:MAG: hypothetical protein EAZ99_06445 [Alphaproteobacteria bacterium]
MSRLATSFVLGYHGCDAATADAVVNYRERLGASSNDYDWLGPGTYFWESDPFRAEEWALEKQQAGRYSKAAVIGAVIDLGNCLDLMSAENLKLLSEMYKEFRKTLRKTGISNLPRNFSPKGKRKNDKLFRKLDCAVISYLHENEVFDSVRGLFIEGRPAFPGSGIMQKTHIQIAVVNPDCIKGVFHWPYPAQA